MNLLQTEVGVSLNIFGVSDQTNLDFLDEAVQQCCSVSRTNLKYFCTAF